MPANPLAYRRPLDDALATLGVPDFDEADIRRCLGGGVFDKGQRYQRQGRVRDLQVDKGRKRLVAAVRGTHPKPYRVFVTLASNGRVDLSGVCTCPVHTDCKHVAAVLIEALVRPHAVAAVSRAAAPVTRPAALAGPLADWLGQLRLAVPAGAAAPAEQILYILDEPPGPGRALSLDLRIVRFLKSGAYSADRTCPTSQLETSNARYVQPVDRTIARLMHDGISGAQKSLPRDAEAARLVLRQIVATGRCHWRDRASPPLTEGKPLQGRLVWRLNKDGRQTVVLAVPGAPESVVALPSSAPSYVDTEAHVAGPLELDLAPALVALLLAAPPVAAAEAASLDAALARDFAGIVLPRPRADIVEEVRVVRPVPALRLTQGARKWHYWGMKPKDWDAAIDVAVFSFAYDGVAVDPTAAPHEQRRLEDGRVVVFRRDVVAEKKAERRLQKLGLIPIGGSLGDKAPGTGPAFGVPDEREDWPRFLHEGVKLLREEGWQVEIAEDFRPRILDGGGDWTADLAEGGAWWFSLDLGVEIAGERVSLLPVLTALLRRIDNPRAPDGLAALARGGAIYARLEDGRPIVLPLERTQAMLAALVELYHPDTLSPDGKLEISAGEAAGIAALEATTRLRWLGGERLRVLVERLGAFTALDRIEPPAGLHTVLRAYQRDGLDWLQFLRTYELGGILADDMGLGKTVQTLAHILVEKAAGRLDRPCLVVCPTSVLPNWRAEAARLAPGLRVLSLHGADRAQRFAEIDEADIVLTTYALLPRDAERLLPLSWSIAVLDESQAIKNAVAKTTGLVCRIDARLRLCLSGTPVENHLGEVWSQFAFLMPGLLGDAKRFARVFRTPIEKKQDGARRALLARRLKPFILRRTKALVAADLPPKTEIAERLDLEGPQRDLYETVRLAMHEKVRREVAAKGLARSHIVVLDALLKLRQVCCDPRLVKLAAARRVMQSAKLEHLVEMVPALVEEGRRILLFSQFTSMLDLIKLALEPSGIPWVELRGDTRDRTTPVARFQSGEVPLFLISLKAGGTGLNLTAADTVIHYDPWWNPAVEDQASDRAHRIGQQKPVFVYKLVTQGTVEERMIELQQRKKALAGALYADRAATAPLLAPADIERLFEPVD